MVNDEPHKGAIQDELNSIHRCLLEPKYHPLPGVPPALRLIEEMLSGSHPSGHPDPITLDCVASYIREEKFRERREKHTDTPLTKDLQMLIDRVKKLKAQAEIARPQETLPSGWWHRHWEGGMIDQVFSLFILSPFFILLVALLFINIPLSLKGIILSSYLTLCMCLSIAIKSSSLLFYTLELSIIIVLLVASLHINHFHLPELTP